MDIYMTGIKHELVVPFGSPKDDDTRELADLLRQEHCSSEREARQLKSLYGLRYANVKAAMAQAKGR